MSTDTIRTQPSEYHALASTDPAKTNGSKKESDAATRPLSRDKYIVNVQTDGFDLTFAKTSAMGQKVRTRKGSIRYTAAAMARLRLLDHLFARETEPIEYHQGFSVEQREGEFISSIKALARSIYARCFFNYSALHLSRQEARRSPDVYIANVRDERGNAVPSFKQFNARFRNDINRHISTKDEDGEPCPDPLAEVYVRGEDGGFYGANYLWDLGQAATKENLREMGETTQTKSRDLYGKRLSIRGTTSFAGILPERDPVQRMVQATYVPDAEEFTPDRATSYLTSETVRRYGMHRAFAYQRTWHGAGTPWRVAKGFEWQQRTQRRSVATDPVGSVYKHISVGAFLEHEADPDGAEIKQNRACIIPFVVFDLDTDSTELAKEYVYAMLNRLSELGVDLEGVVVSYTGGTGFHVRVPAGMLGNPIFRTAKDAKEITRRFADYLFGSLLDGQVAESIDESKFSPNTLIRAIGSKHEKTGRYCVAYSGKEFADLSPWRVQVQGHSDVYSPYRLSDPQEAPVCPTLAAALDCACQDWEAERAAQNAAEGFQESRGIIERIEQGVRKGENFAADYEGRNRAANLLSLNYVQRFGRREAWERVKEWNRTSNTPPLDERELRRAFESAADYAERQAV